MNPVDPVTAEIRRRQRARAIVTGVLLGAFAILLYLITIARIGGQ
jgi:hypothetical protein